MNGASRSVKNTAKNVFLVFLVLLLVVLCAAGWLAGLNISQMSADNPLRRVYDQISGGAVGYELKSSGIAAAEPVQIAISVDGKLSGVQYNPSDLDAGLEAVRAVWSEAFAGLKPLIKAEEASLTEALAAGECVFLRYHGAIQLSVLAGWLGGSTKQELAAETLVYSDTEKRLYIRTETGELYAAETRVDAGTMQGARESFRGAPCEFAGSAYQVYPETLLFEKDMMTLPLLRETELSLFDTQGGGSLQTLLSAFGYTPYVQSYTERDGEAEVFVDDVSMMTIHANGLIQYSAAGAGGKVKAFDRGEAEGAAALDAQLDCARKVLDTAMRAVEAETRASLCAVTEHDGLTTLSFVQTYSGVPVLGDDDFATFVFRDGVLLTVSMHLQRFEADTVRRSVMPARQAAAAADGTMRDMMVAYREQDGVYAPGRYFLK